MHHDPANIETERLWLRAMRADDVDDLLTIFADPRVMASFGVGVFDRAQMERWVQRNLEHQQRYGYGLFSVIHNADRRLIGDCGLENMEIEGVTETELGYDFRSDYWNQGLATEAAASVRDYAFGPLALRRLVSLIRDGNLASQRVAEKIGMCQSANIVRNGHAYCVYSLTNA